MKYWMNIWFVILAAVSSLSIFLFPPSLTVDTMLPRDNRVHLVGTLSQLLVLPPIGIASFLPVLPCVPPPPVITEEVIRGWAFLVAQWSRIPLPMQDMQVQSLGWEDPLEKEMTTHCSIFVWEIPWTEEPAKLQPMDCKKSWTQLSN